MNSIEKLYQEAALRRRTLLDTLPENALLLLEAAPLVTRHHDVAYPFYQASNFWYLCPLNEPNALLLLHTTAGKQESILFCEQKTAAEAKWTGMSIGARQAQTDLLLDAAYPNSEKRTKLTALLKEAQHIYYDIFAASDQLQQDIKQASVMRHASISQVVDNRHLLHTMRRIKSPFEINIMQQAADWSANAFIQLMQQTSSLNNESDIATLFEYYCRRQGSQTLAYPTIAASGKNACVLHYTQNNALLNQGDMLLVDAGCEAWHYASDITRSWPISGIYTPLQKELYQLVLTVQQSLIDMVRPAIPFSALQKHAVAQLTDGLLAIGILKGTKEMAIKQHAIKPYYMHGCSHWLGLDVHDPCDTQDTNGQAVDLAAGMTLTIEPGLYIENHKKYGTIGIRIEDDVAVTETGAQLLSWQAPKTIEDIEALCK